MLLEGLGSWWDEREHEEILQREWMWNWRNGKKEMGRPVLILRDEDTEDMEDIEDLESS
jgi:hypothetical protein